MIMIVLNNELQTKLCEMLDELIEELPFDNDLEMGYAINNHLSRLEGDDSIMASFVIFDYYGDRAGDITIPISPKLLEFDFDYINSKVHFKKKMMYELIRIVSFQEYKFRGRR